MFQFERQMCLLAISHITSKLRAHESFFLFLHGGATSHAAIHQNALQHAVGEEREASVLNGQPGQANDNLVNEIRQLDFLV